MSAEYEGSDEEVTAQVLTEILVARPPLAPEKPAPEKSGPAPAEKMVAAPKKLSPKKSSVPPKKVGPAKKMVKKLPPPPPPTNAGTNSPVLSKSAPPKKTTPPPPPPVASESPPVSKDSPAISGKEPGKETSGTLPGAEPSRPVPRKPAAPVEEPDFEEEVEEEDLNAPQRVAYTIHDIVNKQDPHLRYTDGKKKKGWDMESFFVLRCFTKRREGWRRCSRGGFLVRRHESEQCKSTKNKVSFFCC